MTEAPPVPLFRRCGSEVAVLGAGRLATALTSEGARPLTASEGRPTARLGELVASADAPVVLIVAADGWRDHGPAVRSAGALGITVLPVWTELDRVLIGPLTRPGVPGCPTCVRLRRARARADAAAYDAVRRRYFEVLSERPAPTLTAPASSAVAALCCEELDGDGRRLVVLELESLVPRVHRFLPEPLCPDCGRLPDDSREGARLALRSRTKLSARSWRVRDVRGELPELRQTYVDEECGLIRELKRGVQGTQIVAGAILPLRRGGGTEPGVGRSRSYLASESIAMLEALERWGGTQPGGKRTCVVGSRSELGSDALDVRTLGVHAEADYASSGFGFRRFTDDAPSRWVWGYSFARRDPILVPETIAYYHVPQDESEVGRPFVYENSNGCALGGCLEEAILYGLLEVIERDAFLAHWYARIPAVPIDLTTADNREIPLQAAAVNSRLGYRLQLFDVTPEHGVPCVWAMARDLHPGPQRPALVCAAGAHLDPEQATLSAICEVSPLLEDLVRRYPGEAERARAMVEDSALVRTMPDHSLLYGHPGAARRLEFLTAADPPRPLRSVGRAFAPRIDLREDLQSVLDRLLAVGLDVIVVDQTTAEHAACNLACAKVLVPGAVPMTFGQRLRRTEGLDRLLRLPQILGHHSHPLVPRQLNPHPHPFP